MTSITNAHVHYPPGDGAGYYDQSAETVYVPPAAPGPLDLSAGHLRRSPWLPVPFLVPTALCGASWLAGGVQVLTDLGFTFLSILCAGYFIRELMVFRHRFGLGGMLVFGGSLVWWSHDYFSHWFGEAHGNLGLASSAPIVAKGAFITSFFVLMMTIGLLIPGGRRAERLVVSLPEPTSTSFYFYLVIVLFAIGVSPYFLFTNEPFYSVIWKEMFAMRAHRHVTWWTVGRTGTLNYNWGAYIIHIIHIGWFGGILAAFYALMIGRSMVLKGICWAIWVFWTLLAFGSGTRGYIVFFVLPVVALVFIKTELRARRLGRFNFSGYAIGLVVLLGVLLVIQFQGLFRATREHQRDLGQVELFVNRGNHMFSEPLRAYGLVPKAFPFTRDTFPAASVVRPLPDVAIRFATGWIPRALWVNKPGFDDFSKMYNKLMSGGNAENRGGATICLNVAGGAYVQYGLPGVLQMGILYGWLCALVERGFRRANFRPAATLFVLGLFQYMFRGFRDLTPHDLYPLLIGAGAMAVLVVLSRPLFGRSEPEPQAGYGYDPAAGAGGAGAYA